MSERLYQVIRDLHETANSVHQGAICSLTAMGADALLEALPPGLIAAATVKLPTTPGWYIGYDKVAQAEVVLRFDRAGNGNTGHTGHSAVVNPGRFAPFHPLVRGDL